MSQDQLKLAVMAANIAIKEMLRGRYFNICAIDAVGHALGINVHCQSYNILRAVHCVDFSRLPQEFKDQIPALIADCFKSTTMEFNLILDTPSRVVEAEVQVPKRGFLSKLSSKRSH